MRTYFTRSSPARTRISSVGGWPAAIRNWIARVPASAETLFAQRRMLMACRLRPPCRSRQRTGRSGRETVRMIFAERRAKNSRRIDIHAAGERLNRTRSAGRVPRVWSDGRCDQIDQVFEVGFVAAGLSPTLFVLRRVGPEEPRAESAKRLSALEVIRHPRDGVERSLMARLLDIARDAAIARILIASRVGRN